MTAHPSLRTHSLWTCEPPSQTKLQSNSLEISNVSTIVDPVADSTTPEELLLAASAACYLLTLRAILTNRGIPVQQIELFSEARVETIGGLRFDAIEHHPKIILEEAYDENQIEILAAHAEHACMVSSALRGNVKVSVHSTVELCATL